MILSFELTMPNVGSWNGQWAGANRRYIKFRNVSKKEGEKFLDGKETKNCYYDFGDGWGVNVEAKKILSPEKRKLEKISAGFLSYDWMIDSMLRTGKILPQKRR